ncbi:MAG: hypothetical protein JWO86_6162 [Myxococcaceae bacterium]|jgi:hypothetical protein|nr:hypothetical protein [Myxococcaceae bacterium]
MMTATFDPLSDGSMGKLLDVALYTDLPTPPSSGIERAPTRAEMTELLEAVVAATHSVAGRLKALAHVLRVLRRCPWVDGALQMELELGEDATTVHLYTERGRVRERALPEAVLDIALDELRFAMQQKPDLFAPFRMFVLEDADRLVFVAPS